MKRTKADLPALAIITPMDADQIVQAICRNSTEKRTIRLANLNLHGLYMFETDRRFREFCQSADYVVIDGWPILALASVRAKKWLGANMRVGSTDWLTKLLESGEPIGITAIGSSVTSARQAQENVSRDHPAVRWEGFDGFAFDSVDHTGAHLPEKVLSGSLVLVGLGMPRQEHWILENADRFQECVVANVGGCIDYFSGSQKLAPRWLGRFGLEWLYRLAMAPTRLSYRYLIEPLVLITVALNNRFSRLIGRPEVWERNALRTAGEPRAMNRANS